MEEENKLCIRQIGDAVLHREASPITDFSLENRNKINKQIKILQYTLSKVGGVGIAANQCLELARPFKIILVGIDYENQEHVAKVAARYPSVLFPRMKVYINPVITNLSNEYSVFPEGCLSVAGVVRALVLRPISVKILYQDIEGSFYQEELTGSAARVMLHEMDHIQNGKVYIQRIIKEFSRADLIKIEKIVFKVLLSYKNNLQEVNSFLSLSPCILFKRNSENKLIFDENELEEGLKKTCFLALQGIHQKLVKVLSLGKKL